MNNSLDLFFGAANQIRTGDLILTKDVLCLLSYISMITLSQNAKFPANLTLKVYHKIKKFQVVAGFLSAKDVIKSCGLAFARGLTP